MAARIRHGDHDDEFAEVHDINVTPFIDVILVLLIIFMVAAPLATVNVPLDLPVSSAKAEPPPAEPVVLSIQANDGWSVGDRHIEKNELAQAIGARAKGDHNVRIFVRSDKTVSYEHLMEAMDALRSSGYLKISLVGLEGAKGP